MDGANELNGLRFLGESEAHNYAFIVLDLLECATPSVLVSEGYGCWKRQEQTLSDIGYSRVSLLRVHFPP